jgi:hypothetical protein
VRAGAWLLAIASAIGALSPLEGRVFGAERVRLVGARDLAGKPVEDLERGLVLLLFVRTDCPISNRYAPELKRLQQRFGEKVRFVLVYPSGSESSAKVAAHAAEFELPGRIVRDPEGLLVRALGIHVTPEAALLLDARPLYRGRIDDRWLALGKNREVATSHDLEIALAHALADPPEATPDRPAIGCAIP